MIQIREACNEVGEGCKAPPALADFARSECFACGLAVCTSPGCSRRVAYRTFGVRRICASCLEQQAKP